MKQHSYKNIIENFNFDEYAEDTNIDLINDYMNKSVRIESAYDIANKIYNISFLDEKDKIKVVELNDKKSIVLYGKLKLPNTNSVFWNSITTYGTVKNFDEILIGQPLSVRKICIPVIKQLLRNEVGNFSEDDVQVMYNMAVHIDTDIIAINQLIFFFRSGNVRQIRIPECVILTSNVDWKSCYFFLENPEYLTESFNFNDIEDTADDNNISSNIIQKLTLEAKKNADKIFQHLGFVTVDLRNHQHIQNVGDEYVYEYLSVSKVKSNIWEAQTEQTILGKHEKNSFKFLDDKYSLLSNEQKKNITNILINYIRSKYPQEHVDFTVVKMILWLSPKYNIIIISELEIMIEHHKNDSSWYSRFSAYDTILVLDDFNWVSIWQEINDNDNEDLITEAFEFNSSYEDNADTDEINSHFKKIINKELLKEETNINNILEKYYGITKFLKMPFITVDDDLGAMFSANKYWDLNNIADLSIGLGRNRTKFLSDLKCASLIHAGFTKITNKNYRESVNYDLYNQYCKNTLQRLRDKLKLDNCNIFSLYLAPDNGLIVIKYLLSPQSHKDIFSIICFTGEKTYQNGNYNNATEKTQEDKNKLAFIEKREKFITDLCKYQNVQFYNNFSHSHLEINHKFNETFQTKNGNFVKLLPVISKTTYSGIIIDNANLFINNNRRDFIHNLKEFLYGKNVQYIPNIKNNINKDSKLFIQEFQNEYFTIIITNDINYLKNNIGGHINYQEYEADANVSIKGLQNVVKTKVYAAFMLNDKCMEAFDELKQQKTISLQKIKKLL